MQLILIIDTDFNDVTTTEYFLSGLRHRVISTTKAKKGLEYARSAPPDLLVVGLSMTDKESIENIVFIRKDKITIDVPILGLFRNDDQVFIEKMKKVGVQEFLVKPIEKSALIEKVSKMLEISKEIKSKTVESIKEYIVVSKLETHTMITFHSGLKKHVIPEIKNVFKKDFLESILNTETCLDLRSLPELTEEEVAMLEKIVLIFGNKKISILAGRNLGPILTHADELEEKVNLFMSPEEFEEFLKNSLNKK
ncbi:MAG: response regulator [Leptospiraceae bacterium]|nr:response regulator [Leptospiraceae bacterium]MCP5512607.1 response regulator [Leptospiraceae bacterium]